MPNYLWSWLEIVSIARSLYQAGFRGIASQLINHQASSSSGWKARAERVAGDIRLLYNYKGIWKHSVKASTQYSHNLFVKCTKETCKNDHFLYYYKLCNQLEEVSQCTFQKALLVFYLNDICCLSELFLSLHLWPLVTHSIKGGQQISEISFPLTQRNQFRFQVILLSVHLWQLARSQCELTFISVLSVRTSCVPLSTVRLASSVQFIPHGFLANIIKCTSGKNGKFFWKYKSSKTRGR